MLIKLAGYDLKIGIFRQYFKWLAVPVLFLAAYIDYAMRFHAYQPIDKMFAIENSLGNVVLFVFGGMFRYQPGIDEQFIFPALWIMIGMLLSYFTLHYPYKDMDEMGQNMLIQSGGRRIWWISKCIWNLVSVIFFFLIGWLVIILCCLVQGVPLSMELSPNIVMMLNASNSLPLLYPTKLNFELMILPVMMMLALSMMQMTLSLIVRPIYSFMVTGTILMASAYWQNPLLIGNYGMALRSSNMVADGVNPAVGFWYALGILLISFVIGLLCFSRYDIIKKRS